MITEKQLFLKFLAQTSNSPLMLEIEKAEGIYIYDKNGKKYIDLIGGIAVSNIGHRHPNVIKAIKDQTDRYLHTMVYGEYIQSSQIDFASLLINQLPVNLNSVYLVNSGSEANEGAIKLAKKYTGRFEIIAFKNAYHGSTQGSLSLMGCEEYKIHFRPLIPGIQFIEFNNSNELERITHQTAAVIVEPVQGEAGVIFPQDNFLKKLAEKCKKEGSLLIFDEAQTGFGRTGNLFAFEKYKVIPDVITIAKGMGGGMPIGGFVSSKEIMQSLSENPALGHITTFGGHPVSSAAAYASLNTIIKEKLMDGIPEKEKLFKKLLKHKKINNIRGLGLMLAVELENHELVKRTIKNALMNGLITDWFLFCSNAIRIAPPLIITEQEIKKACDILLTSIV